mgnify:FL=1
MLIAPPILAVVAAVSLAPGVPLDGMPRVSQDGISGVVFADRNGNGARDASEPGIAGVAVSDQDTVVVTDGAGRYRLVGRNGTGVVFVSVPEGYRAAGRFWAPATSGAIVDFPLRRLAPSARTTFIHASDVHVDERSLPRMRRLLALVDSIAPSFVIVTGDLVRDALRVGEAEAAGYYELFGAEAAKVKVPLWTVPGNHEIFGIERERSGVSAAHPLYGRGMYRHFRGPDYYSFNAGGIHFVGLNTVDMDDTRYYGHVDSLQLQWLARDLAVVPPGRPVVTFNHIPFFSALEVIHGYSEEPPAPSVIDVGGKKSFRHTVSNASAVIERMRGRPYPLALAGHVHARESLRYAGVDTRFDQGAAVLAPTEGGGVTFPSGVTVYEVRAGRVGEGRFVPLGLGTAGR